jgi:hypothetical protein
VTLEARLSLPICSHTVHSGRRRALSKICTDEARSPARDRLYGTHSFSILTRALVDARGSVGLQCMVCRCLLQPGECATHIVNTYNQYFFTFKPMNMNNWARLPMCTLPLLHM